MVRAEPPIAQSAEDVPAQQAPVEAAPSKSERTGTDTIDRDTLDRLQLDTGRRTFRPAEPGTLRLQLHGAYQARYQHVSSYPLTPTTSAVRGNPALIGDSIGQNNFLTHWLRITPKFQIEEKIELIAQMDILTGLVIGDLAHDTREDATPRDAYNGFSNVQPRWLYADIRTPIGLLRVGQQPNHWAMGIVANDGNHRPLFGDYRYGDIVERVLFATKPGGEQSPIVVAAGADLVFRDPYASLARGDNAIQAVLASFYEKGLNRTGVYAAYRSQNTIRSNTLRSFRYADELDVFVLDAATHLATPLPGHPDIELIAEAEAATIYGSTNIVRTPQSALTGEKNRIVSYGGAARIALVGMRADVKTDAKGKRYRPDKDDLFGRWVAQLEMGYASGDADPFDDTERRFTFNPNHRVGLLLFDEVMRFQTARAATAATDPLLSNANRPPAGVNALPSNGGVFGATYLNPTFVYRPRSWLDFKGGMVLAQTTADMVDPYRLVRDGAYVNYQGGSPARHDLGVELDGGTEARIPLSQAMLLAIGAQAGVLFPGGAFEDQARARIGTPWLAIGRLGLEF